MSKANTKGKGSIMGSYNAVYRAFSVVIIALAVLLVAGYISGVRMYHVMSGSTGELMPVGSACFVSTCSGYEDIASGDVTL